MSEKSHFMTSGQADQVAILIAEWLKRNVGPHDKLGIPKDLMQEILEDSHGTAVICREFGRLLLQITRGRYSLEYEGCDATYKTDDDESDVMHIIACKRGEGSFSTVEEAFKYYMDHGRRCVVDNVPLLVRHHPSIKCDRCGNDFISKPYEVDGSEVCPYCHRLAKYLI